jgi:hypothetical protein
VINEGDIEDAKLAQFAMGCKRNNGGGYVGRDVIVTECHFEPPPLLLLLLLLPPPLLPNSDEKQEAAAK